MAKTSRFRSAPFVVLAVVLCAIMVAAIVFAYESTSRTILADNERFLSALMEVQARSIIERVRQRRAVGIAVATDPQLNADVARWLQTRSPEEMGRITERLESFQKTFDIAGLLLFDASARQIAGAPLADDGPKRLTALMHEALGTGKTVFIPIWQAHDGQHFQSFLIPLAAPGQGDAPPRTVLMLNAAVHETLYASLAQAVRGAKTADIFLMRRDQDKGWIITTPQRAGARAPLTTHVPEHLYDFAAPTQSHSEPAIGLDHDGRTVLAVKREVAGTPAILIGKIEKDEILRNARVFTILSVTLVGLATLLAFAVGIAIHQRNARRASERLVEQANALREAEALFRSTFEQAAVGIAHVGLNDAFLRVNNTLCRMLGYSKEELEGMPFQRIRTPEDAAEDAALQHKLINGRVPYVQREKRCVTKEGTPLWLACTSSLVRDQDGKPDYFITVLQDISARRAQEEALRESQERFELAVRGTEEGVWDWDRKTRVLYLSPRCRTLLDIGPDQAVDLKYLWHELLSLDDRQSFKAAWRRLLNGQSPIFECELRLRRGEGGFREYAIRGFASRDHAGRLKRIVGLLADVTERRQTERRLRLAAAVFASSPEGVVVTDLGGNVSAVNPSFTRITGYEEQDVLGQNLRLMHSGRHDRAFYTDMWRSIRSRGSWQGEIWNRRKDGGVILEQLSINTVYDENNAPQSYVGAFHDITEIKRSEFALDHMAHFDPLTDLPNRTLLASLLDHAVSRSGAHCAVLCVDLDRFKTVNESFGHLAGDQVLRTSADRMRRVIGANATLGRYGADEFVIILEDLSNSTEAEALATAIIAALAEPFTFADGGEVYVGASVGISLCPDDADNAQHLVQHANSALFEAKANGRGTYSFYTQTMTQIAKTRVELEADLRRALAREEFVLYYQPFVELASGRIRGVEALVRWQSPTHGLVMPDRFIPLAEETGLIVPLGDWVLKTACQQMALWRKTSKICDYMAVNLSPRQFNQDDLCNRVAEVLEQSGLPAEALEIEITESVLFDSRANAEQKCERFHAMGVRLALDDFGTGYSSLGYLKRFPITKLKIDRSFVLDLPRSVADSEIADAIIAVARALGLEVVAEGIETQAQYTFLNAHGCDLGQGFLFSRPQPVATLEALVAQGLPRPVQ